jgi:hypothetical protein
MWRIVFACMLAAALVVVACGGNNVPATAGGADMATMQPSSPMPSTPSTHRPSSPGPCTPQGPGYCPTGMGGSCAKDADCTGGLDGRCVVTSSTACGCRYDACRTDADCAAGTDCACDAQRGGAGSSGNPTVCVPSDCRTDADCGSRYCSPSVPGSCGGNSGWFCHTAADECGNDADCATTTVGMRGACIHSAEIGHWVCMTVPLCGG